jgi:hypothetical protein
MNGLPEIRKSIMPTFELVIHASRLDAYADCPLQAFAELMRPQLQKLGYQFNDLPRYITPEVGTAIHSGVAHLHTTGSTDVKSAVNESLNTLERIMEDTPHMRFTEKMPDLAYIKAHITGFISAYVDQVLPQRSAQLIEYGMKGELLPNITYKTTLDLLTSNAILADLKSGAKITPAYNQLGFYCLLLQREGYKVNRLVLDYILPDRSTKVYIHKPIEYDKDACLFIVKQTLTSLIADFEVFCKTGNINHIRVNPRASTCNKAMCPLYGTSTCHIWRK